MINTILNNEIPIVHLVDYGFADKFADKFVKGNSKEHIEIDSATDTFKGNIEYSSFQFEIDELSEDESSRIESQRRFCLTFLYDHFASKS